MSKFNRIDELTDEELFENADDDILIPDEESDMLLDTVMPPQPEALYTDKVVDAEIKLLSEIRDNQSDLTQDYVRLHPGIKTQVIYYNQITHPSDDVINRDAPSAISGAKYDRIDNFIILIDSELSTSMEHEEGIDTTVEMTATTLPGTVKPYPNDLIIFKTFKTDTLYRVTLIEPISPDPNTGYKLTFEKHRDQFTENQLTKLVGDYYIFLFDNVGTQKTTLLKNSLYKYHKNITDTTAILSEYYIDKYYDNSLNIIRCCTIPADSDKFADFILFNKEDRRFFPQHMITIFDPFLTYFINNNCDSIQLKNQDVNIYPVVPTYMDEDFKLKYNKTIFKALERRNPKMLILKYLYPMRFQTTSPREYTYKGMYFIEYLSAQTLGCVDLYPDSFCNRIISNNQYSDITSNIIDKKYNIIINYLNNKDYIISEQEFEFLKSIPETDDINMYELIPMFLFILKSYDNIILERQK